MGSRRRPESHDLWTSPAFSTYSDVTSGAKYVPDGESPGTRKLAGRGKLLWERSRLYSSIPATVTLEGWSVRTNVWEAAYPKPLVYLSTWSIRHRRSAYLRRHKTAGRQRTLRSVETGLLAGSGRSLENILRLENITLRPPLGGTQRDTRRWSVVEKDSEGQTGMKMRLSFD